MQCMLGNATYSVTHILIIIHVHAYKHESTMVKNMARAKALGTKYKSTSADSPFVPYKLFKHSSFSILLHRWKEGGTYIYMYNDAVTKCSECSSGNYG